MNKLAGAALVLIALIASTVFPLLTYSVTLAVFGLAHVAVEMRYVESRFVDRLLGPMLTGVGALLAVIIVLRCIKMTGWVSRSQLLTCELVFIAIIASSVLLRWGRQSGVAGVVSGAVAGAIGLGIVLSPVTTMLVLACLHNWTPVGFIAEATTGARRRRWMMVCGLVFIAIPLLIASGVIQHLLAPWLSPDFTVLPTGPLKRNMGAFLPAVWHKAEWAPRVFSRWPPDGRFTLPGAVASILFLISNSLHLLPSFCGGRTRLLGAALPLRGHLFFYCFSH